MKLKRLLSILLLLFPLFSFAQTYTIKGVITDEQGKPAPNAKVAVPGSSTSTTTNESGEFILNNVPAGAANLQVTPSKKSSSSTTLNVSTTETTADTSDDVLAHSKGDTENIPTISGDEEGSESPSSSTETVSSALGAGRDVFANAASYNFSIARFRVRGYDDENFVTLMNGVPMNDLTTGRSLYNTWSGLNDVVRSRETTSGLSPAYYSFGEIGGTTSIDSRASHQRKQLQASYSIADRTYDNRFMITYGSGLSKNGWAYSVSYSRRWAQEGYVKGTYYDGHSYFASIEKYIGAHSISLTAMGAPTENGRGKSSYQEMYDLAGDHYYNPNWGYQNGKVRNSAVGKNHQPLITLTHTWQINEKSTLQSAVGYSFGYNRVSSLDWFNALNPRPDYYRNLPSFDANHSDDLLSAVPYHDELAALLRDNEDPRQLNWDALYQANAMHDTVYGDTKGLLAKYVLQDYVTKYSRFSFNSFYNNVLNDHTKLTLGFSYQNQTSEYYKELTDLLGADFYVDLNQFVDLENPTQTSIQQNDLNNPNSVLKVGDRFGYDYIAHVRKYSLWGQTLFNYDRFDYMLAVNLNTTNMYREGKTRNGIFPENSYGKSLNYTFPDAGMKGGMTYKYNGRNYFFGNASFETRAPYFDNLFTSPKTNDRTANADDEFITSFEGGYQLKTPRVRGKLTGFYTQYTDETETFHYYDESFHTFVNYSLTGINKRHEGIEAALEVNVGKGFTADAVVSAGQYFYTSRPTAMITQDSKDSVLAQRELIYLNNVRLSNGPQDAYTLGVNYRSPHFWFLSASVNMFDGIYYDASFTRRQTQSLDLVDAGSAKWNEILQQKQSFTGYTVDMSGGWSWKVDRQFKSLKRPSYIVLNIGINNITDNQDIVTRAAEPLRFDFADKDVNKFAPRITYAYGRTYFINLTLRMN